jgi:hypothetical protein
MSDGAIGTIILLGLIGLGVAAWYFRQQENTEMRPKPPAPGVERAVIVEEIEITNWGNFSRIGLIIAIAIETFGLLGANTVLQQTQVGVAFIGSAVLFGLGMTLGRKRTYRVYKRSAALESVHPASGWTPAVPVAKPLPPVEMPAQLHVPHQGRPS